MKKLRFTLSVCRLATPFLPLAFAFLALAVEARPAQAQGLCATCLGYCSGDPDCPGTTRCGGDTTTKGDICLRPSDCKGNAPTCSNDCTTCTTDEHCGGQGICQPPLHIPVSAVILHQTRINGIDSSNEGSQDTIRGLIDRSLEWAQAILDQAGICLGTSQIYFEPTELRAPDPGGGPDITFEVDFHTGFDGTHNTIDSKREMDLINPKATELANNPPPFPFNACWPVGGRGYIIVFANCLYSGRDEACEPGVINGVNGKSGDDWNTPVSYIATGDRSWEIFDIGSSIAHEFGHVFGLGTGHHPDRRNLMYEFCCGTELDDSQIAALKEGAARRATNSEHGSWQDTVGDAARRVHRFEPWTSLHS